MSCTDPRTVGFMSDGKTLSWSPKTYSKEYSTFQLPCGKCIECRLAYARQWAIRCVHEAKMHEENCFITLTYDDKHLESPKLIYEHFQIFMQSLRDADRYKLTKQGLEPRNIGFMVTGEYGEKNKRPHWHAIIFNWAPPDAQELRKSERGDNVYTSKILSAMWGRGICEFGTVTLESAGYCARYSAKKLVHGPDGSHEWEPISKKSSKYAIGKRWLEKYYKDIFVLGKLHIDEKGQTCPIPRYYEKWFKEHHPEEYLCYITSTKSKIQSEAQIRAEKDEKEWFDNETLRRAKGNIAASKKKREIRKILKNAAHKRLQDYLKL